MANSNTYIEGLNPGGSQLTTLSDIQGSGLKLPTPTSDFIDIRSPGKIERLFSTSGNSNTLYTTNKPQDSYLKGPISTGTVFRSIDQGQRNKINSSFEASRRDGDRVTRFLKSSAGTKFILKQIVLQGFQPHDETKVYNPASPIISALRLASFGLVDRPTRHLDTSNIVGGLLGGTGLGSVVRTVGGLFGGGNPPVPSPPRSSVASEASRGLGISTFTSFLGGGDRSDKVVSPLARPDVRDLLRGQTATNAYNAPRYSKLVSGGGGSFFGKLLSGAGRFIQNNTVVGGIIPPKQPWAANYRADEETYDLYLNSGKLFDPTQTGIGGGGIMSGVLNSIGFGKKANYSQAARQRFYNKSKNAPNFNRSIVISRRNRYGSSAISTDETAYKFIDQSSQITTRKISGGDDGLKYTDLINIKYNGNLEQSDQLLNYKTLVDKPTNFSDTFSDVQDQTVKNIISNLEKLVTNISGQKNSKYTVNDSKGNIYPQQFGKLPNQNVKVTDGIGFNYLTNIKNTNVPSEDLKYERRWINNKEQTILGKKIQPTNDVDYVNKLDVLSNDQFDNLYGTKSTYGEYGPDIINFYFYDIVNQKYIPFRATVKNITDSNTAEWESIEYLGRPDKQYYYKGFTREVSFEFVVNAHSIKELLPMWTRINYLVGLTRPSNYTLGAVGGFMISPMVQLTLGDFYKNHFIVIKSCNVTIPEEASWETIPESVSKTENWYYGPNKSIEWENSKGLYAQFPRTANINMQMSVIEKDRPRTGRAIWGDAPVKIENGNDVYGTIEKDGTVTLNSNNDFSTNVRYDVDIAAYVDELAKKIKPNE